jgi:hypothetical protein
MSPPFIENQAAGTALMPLKTIRSVSSIVSRLHYCRAFNDPDN